MIFWSMLPNNSKMLSEARQRKCIELIKETARTVKHPCHLVSTLIKATGSISLGVDCAGALSSFFWKWPSLKSLVVVCLQPYQKFLTHQEVSSRFYSCTHLMRTHIGTAEHVFSVPWSHSLFCRLMSINFQKVTLHVEFRKSNNILSLFVLVCVMI